MLTIFSCAFWLGVPGFCFVAGAALVDGGPWWWFLLAALACYIVRAKQ